MAVQNIYISSYFHLNPNCALAYSFVRKHLNFIDTVYTHYVQKIEIFCTSERNVFAKLSFRTVRELECVRVVSNTLGSAYYVYAFVTVNLLSIFFRCCIMTCSSF